jgi:uncharacterized protein (TIGR00730 family)
VFCGSSTGNNLVYKNETVRLGKILAEKEIELIYGGANVGLMGILADSVLQNGGKVTGVIPAFIQDKEIAHSGLTRLITVDTMHRRKEEMERLCDGVIALPGGFGTLDEFFEILTWGQLGLHQKPAGILNVNGYYTHLLHLADTMVTEGFLKKVNREMLIVSDSQEELLEKMINYSPPNENKWISSNQNRNF